MDIETRFANVIKALDKRRVLHRVDRARGRIDLNDGSYGVVYLGADVVEVTRTVKPALARAIGRAGNYGEV